MARTGTIRAARAWMVLLAGAVSLGPLAAAGQVQGPFSDVPADHPASGAVNELASRGLITGYADGRYRGNRPMTRYEVAVALQRLLQQPLHMDFVTYVWPPKPPPGPPLTDVPNDHWAADAVRELREWGIIGGYRDGTYRGDHPMSQREFSLVLQRLREFIDRFQDLNREQHKKDGAPASSPRRPAGLPDSDLQQHGALSSHSFLRQPRNLFSRYPRRS